MMWLLLGVGFAVLGISIFAVSGRESELEEKNPQRAIDSAGKDACACQGTHARRHD